MSIPTDRGFVVVRPNADGTSRVEVHAEPPTAGATPFAVYSGVGSIVRQTASAFAAGAGQEVSVQAVEVTWSEIDSAVYLTDGDKIAL